MFLFLLLLWIIFNGKVTLQILIIGSLICAGICFFASRFMNYSFRRELRFVKCIPDFIAYLAILVFEIIKANFSLAGMIFKGQDRLSPAMCYFNSGLKTKVARTVLADSITLTPGTITVSMHEDDFCVHCLDESLAEGITDSVFVRRLVRMEEKLSGTGT